MIKKNKCDWVCNSECIYNYPEYVNCITYKVIEPLSYIMSTLLMISHGQDVAKNMLSTSIASINSIIDWIKGLQHLQSIRPCYINENERRLTPRVDIELPLIIERSEYKTKNISIGGCLVKLDKENDIKNGGIFSTRLKFNGDEGIPLKAKVVRKEGGFLGLNFLDTNDKNYVNFINKMYDLYRTALLNK